MASPACIGAESAAARCFATKLRKACPVRRSGRQPFAAEARSPSCRRFRFAVVSRYRTCSVVDAFESRCDGACADPGVCFLLVVLQAISCSGLRFPNPPGPVAWSPDRLVRTYLVLFPNKGQWRTFCRCSSNDSCHGKGWCIRACQCRRSLSLSHVPYDGGLPYSVPYHCRRHFSRTK